MNTDSGSDLKEGKAWLQRMLGTGLKLGREEFANLMPSICGTQCWKIIRNGNVHHG